MGRGSGRRLALKNGGDPTLLSALCSLHATRWWRWSEQRRVYAMKGATLACCRNSRHSLLRGQVTSIDPETLPTFSVNLEASAIREPTLQADARASAAAP